MKKLLTLSIVVLMALAMLVGCSSKGGDEPAPTDEKLLLPLLYGVRRKTSLMTMANGCRQCANSLLLHILSGN